MERSIDELLSGETTALPEAVTGDTPITPEMVEGPTEGLAGDGEPPRLADDRPRGPDGKFIKQTGVEEVQAQPVADAGPPPADQLPKDVYEPLKAVRNENRELKQQIEALNQRFATLQQPPAQPEQPVDFWDNPQGAIATQVQQAVMQALQAQKQQQTMERINESEVVAKGKYADYGDAFGAFQQAASANPSLIQQMTSASDPAEFAYKTGKRALELEQVGSLDALIANERAKWEAEAKAAMPAPALSLPSTTATDGSVAGRGAPAWAGPPTLEQRLG